MPEACFACTTLSRPARFCVFPLNNYAVGISGVSIKIICIRQCRLTAASAASRRNSGYIRNLSLDTSLQKISCVWMDACTTIRSAISATPSGSRCAFRAGAGMPRHVRVLRNHRRSRSIKAIHGALDRGMNFLDTADMYGRGRNEELVGRALRAAANRPCWPRKFGNVPAGATAASMGVNGRPDYVFASCDGSLRRLGVALLSTFTTSIAWIPRCPSKRRWAP